jgi:acyl-CoA synthetase (AMP-forming)/AMP-acid ligase II
MSKKLARILTNKNLSKNITVATACMLHKSPIHSSSPSIKNKDDELLLDEKLSYSYVKSNGIKILNETLDQRLNMISTERPNDIAFKFCDKQSSFTYLELNQRAEEMAQNLLSLGYAKGDRLAIMLPNTPDFVVTALACASIGVISVLMNPSYQQFEIEYMLKKTECKGILIVENSKQCQHYEILNRIMPEFFNSNGQIRSRKVPSLEHVFLSSSTPNKSQKIIYKGTLFLQDYTNYDSIKQNQPEVSVDDNMSLLFTVIFF